MYPISTCSVIYLKVGLSQVFGLGLPSIRVNSCPGIRDRIRNLKTTFEQLKDRISGSEFRPALCSRTTELVQ